MKCANPANIADPNHRGSSIRITVPCGKCGACRSNNRADWSFRLKQELKAHDSAFFITVTYDDENLPFFEDKLPTLNKRHLQLYLKRLRARAAQCSENKLRYYAVGEYGSKTDRPHYHIILFGLDSALVGAISDEWHYGIAHVGTVSAASIHYVTKYHVNRGEREWFDSETGEVMREPEFTTMSRRPGIGYNFIEDNCRWVAENDVLYVINNGFKQRMPRYYREKIFPKIWADILSAKNRKLLNEEEDREIERLTRLKVKDPARYIYESAKFYADKVKDKLNEDDLF